MAVGRLGFGYLSGPGIGAQYLGKVGVALGSGVTAAQLAAMVNPYYFPYNPNSTQAVIVLRRRVGRDRSQPTRRHGQPQLDHQAAVPEEHRHFSYFRIYGFTNYSVWPQTCPNTAWTNFVGYCPLNYYVQTTTNGVSASYANQINDKNLINVEVSDSFAHDYRANDTTMVNGGNRPFLWAVNASSPTSAPATYDRRAACGPCSCYSRNAATVTLGERQHSESDAACFMRQRIMRMVRGRKRTSRRRQPSRSDVHLRLAHRSVEAVIATAVQLRRALGQLPLQTLGYRWSCAQLLVQFVEQRLVRAAGRRQHAVYTTRMMRPRHEPAVPDPKRRQTFRST